MLQKRNMLLIIAAAALCMILAAVLILLWPEQAPNVPQPDLLEHTGGLSSSGTPAGTENTQAASSEPEQTESSAVQTEPEETETQDTKPEGTEPEATETSVTQPRETQPEPVGGEEPGAIEFPYQFEGGRLEISSIFQFSGFNPDGGGQEGEDIAAIVLRNLSDEHLTEASIHVTLADGAVVEFQIRDLPAGESVMAFDKGNIPIVMLDSFDRVDCDASFESEKPVMEGKLSITVEGTMVTLTNISNQNLSDLTVYCHSILNGDLFGGLTYGYPAGSLAPGESTTVNAWDCFLGGAEVVRVE